MDDGRRVLGFDGLRGLAASAVVIHHYGMMGTGLGDLAVSAFFVLSGYLIVGILHRSRISIEENRSSFQAEFLGFWRNRAIRLFPVYYIALVAVIALESVRGWVSLQGSWPWYAAYLQNFYIGLLQPYWLSFAHTWSLAVEQQFYLLFSPTLLLVPSRLHGRVVTGILIASFAWITALREVGLPQIALNLLPMSGMTFLAAGGLLSLAGGRFPRSLTGGVSVIAALTCMGCYVFATEVNRHLGLSAPAAALHASVLCALVIVVASISNNQLSRPVRYLEHPIMAYLGRISYGLYVVHVPVAIFGAKWGHMLIDFAGSAAAPYRAELLCALIFVASVGIASILWHAVERPLLAYKAKRKMVLPPDIRVARAIPEAA